MLFVHCSRSFILALLFRLGTFSAAAGGLRRNSREAAESWSDKTNQSRPFFYDGSDNHLRRQIAGAESWRDVKNQSLPFFNDHVHLRRQLAEAITVTTVAFSDSNGPDRGLCPNSNGLQTAMLGLTCQGRFCHTLQLKCYNDGSTQIGSAVSTSVKFSEEQGLGSCPNKNEVITGVQCAESKFCDELILFCQELTSVKMDHNNCGETRVVSSDASQDGYSEIPAESHPVAIRCLGPYCESKMIRYCYQEGAGGGLPITVVTDKFNEDGNGQGACPYSNGLQTSMVGLECSDEYCGDLRMTCYNNGTVQVSSAVSTSRQFSEEQGLGKCPNNNEIITGIMCRGQHADNLFLLCQELSSVKLDYNNCGETSSFTSTISSQGSGMIPSGSYAIGIFCSGGWCESKTIHFCYPEGAPTTQEPTAAPSAAPTSAPTSSPTSWPTSSPTSSPATGPGGPITKVIDKFTDAQGNDRGRCPTVDGLQLTMKSLSCSGEYCGTLQMTCFNNGLTQVNPAISTSGQFSEEQGLGSCPNPNEVITSIRCQSKHCDNVHLFCQELTNVKLNYENCGETSTFPSTISTDGSDTIPNGSYAVGIFCSGDYCGYKSIRYCFPEGSDGSVTITTEPFSDSNGPDRAVCPNVGGLQTTMRGLTCEGRFCHTLQLKCYNDGSTQIGSAVSTSVKFSEEQGLGRCPNDNEVITGAICENKFCDDLYIFCQELTSDKIDKNNCGETSVITSNDSQSGSGEIPAGSYATGIFCSDGYCQNKKLFYCFPQSASKPPTDSPTSAPTLLEATTPARPSFLFMLTDDVGWADFSFNGGNAKTPNIDAWIKRSGSRNLMDFHSGGSVCSPTRATVLTGRSHYRDCASSVYSCRDNLDCEDLDYEFAPMNTFTVADAVRTLPEYDEGCGVFFAGKWHLGNFYSDARRFGGKTSSPTTHGFQCFTATIGNAATRTPTCHCDFANNVAQTCEIGHPGSNRVNDRVCANYWYDDPMSEHGVTHETEPTPPSDAHYMAESFSNFLEDRSALGLPFLAQISFRHCHKPFLGTRKGREDCSNGITCRKATGTPYSFEELDYYACLVELDEAVGEILETLEKEGYYDDTMVWFTSDNGPEGGCGPRGICAGQNDNRPQEAPGSAGKLRGRKRDVYEGGHRVPTIVSFPALLDGSQEIWEAASTLDFLPTVMDILNVDRPQQQRSWAMDGRSILPILDGGRWQNTEEGVREIGFGFSRSNDVQSGWAYRMGPWKLVVDSYGCSQNACSRPQLFNLDEDIGERRDLANSNPTVRRQLEAKLEAWKDSLERSRTVESRCSLQPPWL